MINRIYCAGSLNQKASNETKQALEDLKTKEQKRIVLDLRDNLAVY
jgi:C-terminal processing protease CtpA/Prc